ncbi:MAG: tetratricopeptide repeat protein [Deltaproteobacteria bacterium]|nr:tetratricopeptide repeat protein [Deltaproteobacteria bacterium]
MNTCKNTDCQKEVFKDDLCVEHFNAGEQKKNPQFDINFYLHTVYLVLGRLINKILVFYDDHFTLDKKDTLKVYTNLYTQYRKKGQIEKAIAYAKKAMEVAPAAQKKEFILAVAELSFMNGKTDEAKVEFLNFLKKNPDAPETYAAKVGLANIYSKENDVENAIKYYQEALAQNDKDHQVLYKLALLHDKKKQTEEAISLLEKAIKIAPNELKYHQQIGFIFESKGNHDKAVPHFKRVMELEHRAAS